MGPRAWIWLLAVMLVLAEPVVAQQYRLVPPGPVLVARQAMAVTPRQAWNRAARPAHLPRIAEVWTMDGLPLNALTFFGGIEPGKRLFSRSAVSDDQQLPVFRADMQPQEVVEFVETSLRVTFGTTQFAVTDLKPARFAGQPGFQFDYLTVDSDEVRRRGRAAGTVAGGKLYLIVFEAAATYYFDRHIAEVDHIIASLCFSSNSAFRAR